jgi:hypothetical protein
MRYQAAAIHFRQHPIPAELLPQGVQADPSLMLIDLKEVFWIIIPMGVVSYSLALRRICGSPPPNGGNPAAANRRTPDISEIYFGFLRSRGGRVAMAYEMVDKRLCR